MNLISSWCDNPSCNTQTHCRRLKMYSLLHSMTSHSFTTRFCTILDSSLLWNTHTHRTSLQKKKWIIFDEQKLLTAPRDHLILFDSVLHKSQLDLVLCISLILLYYFFFFFFLFFFCCWENHLFFSLSFIQKKKYIAKSNYRIIYYYYFLKSR